jgi:hypothetical protein
MTGRSTVGITTILIEIRQDSVNFNHVQDQADQAGCPTMVPVQLPVADRAQVVMLAEIRLARVAEVEMQEIVL